jgi:hypothetical protein
MRNLADDSPLLATIKVLDGEVFWAVGLDEEADEPPTSLAPYVESI